MKYLISLMIIACATAAFAGQIVSPDVDKPQFSSVVLWAVGFKPAAREEIERDTIRSFEKHGIRAIAMVDFMPGSDNSDLDAVKERAHAGGIETILQIHSSNINKSASLDPDAVRDQGLPPEAVFGKRNANQRYLPSSTHRIWLLATDDRGLIWIDEVTATGHEHSKIAYLAEKAFRLAARRALDAGLYQTSNMQNPDN